MAHRPHEEALTPVCCGHCSYPLYSPTTRVVGLGARAATGTPSWQCPTPTRTPHPAPRTPPLNPVQQIQIQTPEVSLHISVSPADPPAIKARLLSVTTASKHRHGAGTAPPSRS